MDIDNPITNAIPNREPEATAVTIQVIFDEEWIKTCADHYGTDPDAAIERVRAAHDGLTEQVTAAATELVLPVLLGN